VLPDPGARYSPWSRFYPVGGEGRYPLPATPNASPTFTIDVVDVGTGLAVLVRSSDFSLVYDAGSNDDIAPRTNRMLAYINDVAPAFTTLDYVILSHRENAGPLQWLPSPVTEKGRWGPRCEDAERVRAGASGILC
jgi:hypothetical protein